MLKSFRGIVKDTIVDELPDTIENIDSYIKGKDLDRLVDRLVARIQDSIRLHLNT